MSNTGLDLLRRTWNVLSRRRKWQIVLLGALTLVGTFLEMVSLGAVLPYLAVLMDPVGTLKHRQVAMVAQLLGITTPEALLKPLTIGFITVVIVSGVGRLVLLWTTHRVSYLIGSDLSSEVYRRTLYQPYSVHVARNSSHLIATLTKKIGQTTHIFQQLLAAVTSVILAIGITAALLMVNPVVASISALVFGSGYVLIARVTRRRLIINGKRIKEASTRLVKTLQEGLGGIRDVLLDGTQPIHCDAYRRVDRPLRRATATNGFIAASPRVVMEAFGISAIALLAFTLVEREGSSRQFLPVLGVLAIGAQRLLPAFQTIFAGYAGFIGHQASVAEIVKLMEQPLPAHASEPPVAPLIFQHEVRFDHLSFSYSGTPPWVLDDVNLVIPKGARFGFVGKTGGGKSTALDLLMGLLSPTAGDVLVDGQPISGAHGRAWQRTIAHVPQSIFLSDASIAENIALGVPLQKIDMQRVEHVARIAHVAEFVESQPKGYQTEVGERGVRLSGGQRQRLGIARALYKQASVLVFDEATSALDNATERDLMDAIEGLSRDLTILMVAHRLSTLKRCDKIVVTDQGRIVGVDTYDALLRTNSAFQSLAATDSSIQD